MQRVLSLMFKLPLEFTPSIYENRPLTLAPPYAATAAAACSGRPRNLTGKLM